jgi:hypothetical protein
MAVAVVLVFMVTPPTKVFFENITSPTLWTGLNQRLLPQDKWFGGMAWLGGRAATPETRGIPAGASPIATGSVAAPPKEPQRDGAQ